ncbi:DNA-binding domain-containing protein [Qipengyuania marisflavi]|uniref:DUF2063 domain-containing protein n=1 Tax=Qipengyuania marisflavi TaxID=2486356 RepID=A0A5S3P3E7_9SPHN|nr:DNA-binding domain-containing protein [Qipengyuania marisflavi]TMM47273.1 DUF2063 domain-containing protein [Qipengyuania marisflavi]
MTLAVLQSEFLGAIHDDEIALPDSWDDRRRKGFAIYRNAYRATLVDALRESFARTAAWVGDEAFRAAASHHVIAHPPSSWTLDLLGEGFDATCAELFAQDPEVAELAWLEWAMQTAFVAEDAAPLDAAGFGAATADFAEADWADLTLRFASGMVVVGTAFDLPRIWNSDPSEPLPPDDLRLAAPSACAVWREEERPMFQIVSAAEGQALTAMLAGTSYGELCAMLIEQHGEEAGIAMAGGLLGGWLGRGWIAGAAL